VEPYWNVVHWLTEEHLDKEVVTHSLTVIIMLSGVKCICDVIMISYVHTGTDFI